MLFPRLLTHQTSEAMHVQRNDGQSNRSGKSLRTFRPNTVEATVFKIVDGRLHCGKACNGVPQRGGIGDQVDPPSFVVETPFHQATTERPAGLICGEKIGLARRRLPQLPFRPAVGPK